MFFMCDNKNIGCRRETQGRINVTSWTRVIPVHQGKTKKSIVRERKLVCRETKNVNFILVYMRVFFVCMRVGEINRDNKKSRFQFFNMIFLIFS